MAARNGKDLTTGNPLKLVLGFAAPLMFGFLFQQMYNFVDTAIVGRYLGSSALAAVGSTGSISFLILGLCVGTCSGFAIPIAQSFGAKRYGEMRAYIANAVMLCTLLSIGVGLLTGFLSPTILRWMDTPADIMRDANAYIQLIFFSIPVIVLYNMSSGILRSLGDSKTPVAYLVMAAILNTVLDLVFILVFHWGVFGAALATVVSQLVSGIGCVVTMVRHFPILRGETEEKRYRPIYAKKLLSMGLPMGLQFSITAIGSVILQTAVNGLGTAAVAGIAAANKLIMFFTCMFDALASTMATFAGQNVGARKLRRIGEGLKSASLIGIIYCIVMFVVVYFCAEPLTRLFVAADEVQVIAYSRQYQVVCASMYIPLLFVNLLRLTIQGVGFTSFAIIAGICEMIARGVIGFFFVPVFGFNAACWAGPMAWIFADAFLFPAYFYVMRRLRATIGEAEDEAEAAA